MSAITPVIVQAVYTYDEGLVFANAEGRAPFIWLLSDPHKGQLGYRRDNHKATCDGEIDGETTNGMSESPRGFLVLEPSVATVVGSARFEMSCAVMPMAAVPEAGAARRLAVDNWRLYES